MKKLFSILVLLTVGVFAFAETKLNEIGFHFGIGPNDSYLGMEDLGFSTQSNLQTYEISYERKVEVNKKISANGTPYITYEAGCGFFGYNKLGGDIETMEYRVSGSDWMRISSDGYVTFGAKGLQGVENDVVGLSIFEGGRFRIIDVSVETDYAKISSTLKSLAADVGLNFYFKIKDFVKIGAFASFEPLRYDFGYTFKGSDGSETEKTDGEFVWFSNGQVGLFVKACF